jgi:hypothetical protein
VGFSFDRIDEIQVPALAGAREVMLDKLLQALFQRVMDEPVPPALLALVDRLDAAAPRAL